jgi:hypothetical protein
LPKFHNLARKKRKVRKVQRGLFWKNGLNLSHYEGKKPKVKSHIYKIAFDKSQNCIGGILKFSTCP